MTRLLWASKELGSCSIIVFPIDGRLAFSVGAIHGGFRARDESDSLDVSVNDVV